MKRWLIIVVMLAILLLPQAAAAQASVDIDSMLIDLWPEYDRPEMLVIYRITLSPQAALPARISLRIPSKVERPFNVAQKDVDGLLYTLDYQLSTDRSWLVVNFTTASPDVQLEYYDSGLTRSGTQRSFDYSWPGGMTVKSMTVQVQQPVNARSVQIEPNMGSGRVGQDGLNYYTSLIGEVKSATTFNIHLSYDKPDNELTFNQSAVTPAAPVTDQTAGRTTLLDVLPWILGAFGVVLVGVGMVWYFQTRREPVRQKSPRHARLAKEDDSSGAAESMYCHQCGRRSDPGDAFCRACGTRLKSG